MNLIDFVVVLCFVSSISCRTGDDILMQYYMAYIAEGCKNGWTQFGNKCYFFSHQVEPWSEAMSVCRVFDSKLVEPMTSEESSFIISQSQKVGGSFWIGISDIMDEDRWIYSTGQEPIKVNNFQPGEPNSHTAANCVVLYGPFRGKWADDNCITLHQFVCETNNESASGQIPVVG